MEKIERFENLEEVFDHDYIKSVTTDWSDETPVYHVTFMDGTQRRFYEAADIVLFANCLLKYHANTLE